MSDDPRVNRSLERVERVLRSLDERDGPVRQAAKRERQRLNSDLGRRAARVGIAVGLVSLRLLLRRSRPVSPREPQQVARRAA